MVAPRPLQARPALLAVALGALLFGLSSPNRQATAGVPAKLLLQSICVAGTWQEYISIYNPNGTAVDLSDYYITDATHIGVNTLYIYIANRTAGIAGGGAFNDFHIRFPAGARIAPHDTIAVAHQGTTRFLISYGRKPAFEIGYPGMNDPEVPDMRAAFPGSVPGTPDSTTLTNGGECVVLYYWDGQSDLATDVDYAFWGTNTGSYVVDKTGMSVDGPDADTTPTAYQADTAPAMQVPILSAAHPFGNAFRREDYTEGTQRSSGGNGVNGRDETSEPLNVTWSSNKPAAPPFVKAPNWTPALPTTWGAIKTLLR